MYRIGRWSFPTFWVMPPLRLPISAGLDWGFTYVGRQPSQLSRGRKLSTLSVHGVLGYTLIGYLLAYGAPSGAAVA